MPIDIGSKRPSSDNEEQLDGDGGLAKVRLLLLGRFCGALIGKGGENFKRLREDHGVKITGLKSRANERVLQLDGEVAKCLDVIDELIPSCPEARYKPDAVKSEVELNLLANTDVVGLVVGKGGSKMKEIRDATGCRLKVYPECLPNSNERVVAIGAADQATLLKGAAMVIDIIENSPRRSSTVYFKAENNLDPTAMMDLTKKNDTNARSGDSYKSINKTISSMIIAQREYKKSNPVDAACDIGAVETVTTLTMSNDMCGAVIGKGGQSIQMVRHVSGAKIEFPKPNVESEKKERIITITGTLDKVRLAVELITEIVRGSNLLLEKPPGQQMNVQQSGGYSWNGNQQPGQQWNGNQQSAGHQWKDFQQHQYGMPMN